MEARLDVARKCDVLLVGHVPPPLTGQTIASQTLGEMLCAHLSVRMIPISPPRERPATSNTEVLRSVKAVLSTISALRQGLRHSPNAVVCLTALSPQPLGHLRDLIIWISCLRTTGSVVGVVHWGQFHEALQRSGVRWSLRFLCRRLSRVIFLSPRLAEAAASAAALTNATVIPNSVRAELHWLRTDVEEARRVVLRSPTVNLLFPSNMHPDKGSLDVLRAVRALIDRGVRVRANFLGAWPSPADKRRFEGEAASLQVEPFVQIQGGVSRTADIRAALRRARMVLLPTVYPTEAQPLVLLEALASGTPIVAYPRGAIAEVLGSGGGRGGCLVGPSSPSGLADAVHQLCDDETWLSCSEAAFRTFQSSYSQEIVVRRWIELFSAVSRGAAK